MHLGAIAIRHSEVHDGFEALKNGGKRRTTNMRTPMPFYRFLIPALTVLCLSAAPPTARAATYYVDGNHSGASDSNPGTESQPWKTIQRAANVAAAGDTVLVKAGTYNEAVSITRSGTAGARITFKAYPGTRPVIDGTGKVPNWRGVVSSGTYSGGTRHIILDGFEIRNSTSYGIRLILSGNWEIRNCRIYNADKGGILLSSSSNVLISNNRVFQTGWNGISIMGGGYNVIEYNRCYDNHFHNGVNIITDHTVGDTAFHDRNVVRYNYIYYNQNGIYARNQRYMQIYGNVIYDNDRNAGYAGIFLHEGDGTSSSFVSNSRIYNNTIVGQPKGIVNSSHWHVDIKNNILYFQTSEPLRISASNQIIDYNIYYGKDNPDKGPHDFYADPRFVDAAKKDFRVTSDSPALGAGEGDANIGAVPPPGTAPVDSSPPPPATTVPSSPKNFRM
jgi:parallel beta-helix repeat protein